MSRPLRHARLGCQNCSHKDPPRRCFRRQLAGHVNEALSSGAMDNWDPPLTFSKTTATRLTDSHHRRLPQRKSARSSKLPGNPLLFWGSINIQTVSTPKVEISYRVTITFSRNLGTALGDGAGTPVSRPMAQACMSVRPVGRASLPSLRYDSSRFGDLAITGHFVVHDRGEFSLAHGRHQL